MILPGDIFKFLLSRWYLINNFEWSKLGTYFICNIDFQCHQQSLMKKSDEKSFMKSDGDPYYSWFFCINYASVVSPSSFLFFVNFELIQYNMQHIKLVFLRLTRNYFYQLDKKTNGLFNIYDLAEKSGNVWRIIFSPTAVDSRLRFAIFSPYRASR